MLPSLFTQSLRPVQVEINQKGPSTQTLGTWCFWVMRVVLLNLWYTMHLATRILIARVCKGLGLKIPLFKDLKYQGPASRARQRSAGSTVLPGMFREGSTFVTSCQR